MSQQAYFLLNVNDDNTVWLTETINLHSCMMCKIEFLHFITKIQCRSTGSKLILSQQL